LSGVLTLDALEDIAAYVSERNPYATEALISTIEETAEALPQHPICIATLARNIPNRQR